jgi:hypothetical protein
MVVMVVVVVVKLLTRIARLILELKQLYLFLS